MRHRAWRGRIAPASNKASVRSGAAEALLAAANRGVLVWVLVDDLLIDTPDKSLLALAKHPLIDIRIYNPRTSVGVVIHDAAVSRALEQAIARDMRPGESWNAADDPDRHAPLAKCDRVQALQLLRPLL